MAINTSTSLGNKDILIKKQLRYKNYFLENSHTQKKNYHNYQGSRHKLIYDGMWHLDIPKCQERDHGKIEVIARNQCGEAYSTTTLTVKRRKDDYRSVLKHNVKRKYPNCS